jgi:hypothetical protein
LFNPYVLNRVHLCIVDDVPHIKSLSFATLYSFYWVCTFSNKND